MQKKLKIPARALPLVRFFLFQMAWWLLVRSFSIETVLGIRHYSNVLAVIISGISIYLILANRFSIERVALITLALVGFITDSAYFSLGLIAAEPSYAFGAVVMAPLWLLGLWLAFAAAVFHSVDASMGKVLQTRKSLTVTILALVAMGGLFGPLSYLVGEPLGVLEIQDRNITWMLALEWAFFFPLMFFVSLAERGQKKSGAL